MFRISRGPLESRGCEEEQENRRVCLHMKVLDPPIDIRDVLDRLATEFDLDVAPYRSIRLDGLDRVDL